MMQTVMPSEFKRGMVLMLGGVAHLIEDFHTTGTAQTRHKLHTRLRQLKTGRLSEHVFSENDRVGTVELEHHTLQFSYQKGDEYVFQDVRTFEEVLLPVEQIGDRRWFIQDTEEYKALFLEGKLVDIILPLQITLTVVETGPSQKGGADGAWKPARLNGGLEIMVPLFIATGEAIRVDTQTHKYVGKAGEK